MEKQWTANRHEKPEMYDFSIFDQCGNEIGEIGLLTENPTSQEMPQELEINGVVYYPQF